MVEETEDTPVAVLGPKIPIQNLVFAMKLVDCEVHSPVTFLGADMRISKQPVHDTSGTLYQLPHQLLASNVPYMHNEKRVHTSV